MRSKALRRASELAATMSLLAGMLIAAESVDAQTSVQASTQSATQAPTEIAPPAGPSEVEQKVYDDLFQQTLQKPADPATLVAFAEIAIQIGDLEGAISAMDRLLLIDGDQPEVKLELGVLYFRLGSFGAAKPYLEEAQASKKASERVKERAAAFLKEIK